MPLTTTAPPAVSERSLSNALMAPRSSSAADRIGARFTARFHGAGRGEQAARVDSLQHPDEHEVRHERAAADGDERERNPGHGRNAHRHPHVDEHLEQEREHERARDDGAVEVARHRDHTQASPDDEEVEEEHDRRAREPALLRERREGEVGGVLGEVVEPGLARLDDAAPREAAGADRGHRLVHVPRQAAAGRDRGRAGPCTRSIWYGLSTSTPAVGRIQRTERPTKAAASEERQRAASSGRRRRTARP